MTHAGKPVPKRRLWVTFGSIKLPYLVLLTLLPVTLATIRQKCCSYISFKPIYCFVMAALMLFQVTPRTVLSLSVTVALVNWCHEPPVGPKPAFFPPQPFAPNKDVPLMPSPFYSEVKPVFSRPKAAEIRRATCTTTRPGNTGQVNFGTHPLLLLPQGMTTG